MKENIIYKKAFEFAVEIIKLCRTMSKQEKEHMLTQQLLRSGTSIGANVAESVEAQSDKDFIHKLSIALKESAETIYWIKLLKEAGYLKDAEAKTMLDKSQHIKAMLIKSIQTKKRNMKNQK